MTGEHYASGNWHVKEGSEDEFIQRWRAFLTESTRTAEGFGSARLLRDSDDPRRFLSFSDWADARSREAWKATSEFEKGLAACRELCVDFVGSDCSETASV
jgi:heme-degrading monooxygenase HmoA